MSLKDHPVFIVIGFCAATAVAAWATSEQVKVQPLRERLAVLEKKAAADVEKTRQDPVILDVKLTEKEVNGAQVIEQNIAYSDPDGDAVFINWIVLETDRRDIFVTSGALTDSPEQQKSRANLLAKWSCGRDKYFVKLRVVIIDRAGHASAPRDYTVNCNA